jgi:hypothetical protein
MSTNTIRVLSYAIAASAMVSLSGIAVANPYGDSPQSKSQVAVQTLPNGGFETGDFSNWVAGDNGVEPLDPWMVGPQGFGYFGLSDPIEGEFDAINGFDGDAGYEAWLYQDIPVPPEGATVTFNDRIQYDSLDIPSSLPRIYEVQVRDLGGALLRVLYHEEILINMAPFTDTGWRARSFDLSDFAGDMIRLQINLFVPENFTGPASFEVDNFALTNGGQPSPDISGCLRRSGSPLSGAQVVLKQRRVRAQRDVTDGSGCFQFDEVRPGLFLLEAKERMDP